jgi:hypothetical protein
VRTSSAATLLEGACLHSCTNGKGRCLLPPGPSPSRQGRGRPSGPRPSIVPGARNRHLRPCVGLRRRRRNQVRPCPARHAGTRPRPATRFAVPLRPEEYSANVWEQDFSEEGILRTSP